jgi:hypothetical protein
MLLSSSVFPMFSCSIFKVSGLTLRSLVHAEFIFTQSKRLGTSFILLHADIHFCQWDSLNSCPFSNWWFLLHCQKSDICVDLFLDLQFYSIGLCVCFCASAMLLFLLWHCSIVWSQVLWFFQHCSFLLRINLNILVFYAFLWIFT